MDVITYSDTRANLKEVMDRVAEDRAPVVITRTRGEAVVMVSLADWNAMEETPAARNVVVAQVIAAPSAHRSG